MGKHDVIKRHQDISGRSPAEKARILTAKGRLNKHSVVFRLVISSPREKISNSKTIRSYILHNMQNIKFFITPAHYYIYNYIFNCVPAIFNCIAGITR